jgi:hypothetical protein
LSLEWKGNPLGKTLGTTPRGGRPASTRDVRAALGSAGSSIRVRSMIGLVGARATAWRDAAPKSSENPHGGESFMCDRGGVPSAPASIRAESGAEKVSCGPMDRIA